ncbi:MAG TPA: hypothetical protein VEC93_08050, partial [Anaerolineae bacterium]|nr:hypothetical protein [Anaerolineae bacterium]
MKIKLLIFFAATLVIAIVAVPALAQLDLRQSHPVKIGEVNIVTPPDSLSTNQLDWSAFTTGPFQSTGNQAQAVDPDGIQRLIADSGGATVSIARATGAVRFVRLTPAQANSLAAKLGAGGSVEAQAT